MYSVWMYVSEYSILLDLLVFMRCRLVHLMGEFWDLNTWSTSPSPFSLAFFFHLSIYSVESPSTGYYLSLSIYNIIIK